MIRLNETEFPCKVLSDQKLTQNDIVWAENVQLTKLPDDFVLIRFSDMFCEKLEQSEQGSSLYSQINRQEYKSKKDGLQVYKIIRGLRGLTIRLEELGGQESQKYCDALSGIFGNIDSLIKWVRYNRQKESWKN